MLRTAKAVVRKLWSTDSNFGKAWPRGPRDSFDELQEKNVALNVCNIKQNLTSLDK